MFVHILEICVATCRKLTICAKKLKQVYCPILQQIVFAAVRGNLSSRQE
jgi:hypothetical protein